MRVMGGDRPVSRRSAAQPRRAIAALLLALAWLGATPVAAAQVLEPGDVLKLKLPPAKTPVTVTIGEDGKIMLPGYGPLKVEGLTVAAARRALRTRLGRFVRHPAGATLELVRAGRLVLITGHVQKPGIIRMGKRADLWQAIAKAGGPGPGADLTRVLLLRDGKRRRIDVAAYLTGDGTDLPRVIRGDTVLVPAGAGLNTAVEPGSVFLSDAAVANKVFVLGSVVRPGMYSRSGEATLFGALAMAGGPAEVADLGNIRLLTPTGTRRLDLIAYLQGETSTAPRIPEQGGAIVFVPAVGKPGQTVLGPSVHVLGGVANPGRISVRGPMPLVELLSLAGGPVERAELDEVHVVRRGKSFTLATRYDVEEFFAEGGLVDRVIIQPGDTVYIGHRAPFEVWTSIVQVVSSVSVLAASFAIFAGL